MADPLGQQLSTPTLVSGQSCPTEDSMSDFPPNPSSGQLPPPIASQGQFPTSTFSSTSPEPSHGQLPPLHGQLQSTDGQLPPITHFDHLFSYIGSFGRYQAFVAFCVQYSCLMLAGNFYMMTFGTLKPKLHCSLDNSTSETDYCSLPNCTDSNGSSHLVDNSDFYSIVDNFDLLCKNDYIPNMMISIQMLGQALGNPIGGHLADYVGRKWISYIGFLFFLGSGLLCSVAQSWQMLTVFMFGLGLSFGFYLAAMFSLSMELTGKKYRLFMNCTYSWCISFQVTALVAYLTRDWRLYMITVNCLCLPLAVMMWFIDESPRWLIQKGKFTRARKVLDKIAKWNGRKERVGEERLKTIQLDSRQSKYSLLLLFSTRTLFIYSLIIIISVFFCSSLVGVILFNVDSLAGSPFLNVALYGLLRIWAPPLLVLLDRKSSLFGRRPMYLSSLLFVLLCLLAIIIIHSLNMQTTDPWHLVVTALSLAASCITAGVLDVAAVQYEAELFPTVIRSIACGTFNVADDLGSVIAPQLLYLQKYWRPLPYCVVAVFGIVAWIMGFLVLPETAGKPLPDTLQDMEQIRGFWKCGDSSDKTDDKVQDEDRKEI